MSQPTTVPVQLPNQLDGVRLVWGQWELAPVLSHVPNDCEHCAFDRQPALAMATSPDRVGRWIASRCRRCQATRVITWLPEPRPFGSHVQVWSAAPQPYRRDE